MKQQHVLQLTRRFAPSTGGVETHVLELTTELLKRGYACTIFTVQHDSTLPTREEMKLPTGNCLVLRMPQQYENDKLATWRWIYAHRQYCAAATVQVHDVNWWILPLLPQLLFRYYSTFHGWEGVFPIPFLNKLQRWVLAKLAAKTVHIGAYIQQFYWDTPTQVLYGGVRVSDVTSKVDEQTLTNERSFSHAQLGSSSSPLRFVFLGRLVPENDIALYCAFLELLQEHSIAFVCTWVGDGPLRQQCSTYGSVTGMVQDRMSYIAQADVVGASSYLSLLEAQAVEKLVVALYTTPLKKAYLAGYPGIAHTCWSNAPETAVQQLQEYLNSPARVQKTIAAAQRLSLQHSWEAVADAYEALWNRR